MIFGECPYEDCNEPVSLPMPEMITVPMFAKVTCEKCKRWFWERYSRFDPEAYTPEDFAKKFEVDEETRIIKDR